MSCKAQPPVKLRVANLGIQTFYDALLSQDVECVQIEWQPPIEQDKEIMDLLDEYL